MLTLDQWKTARRVDHTSILGFHPRYRNPAGRPDLKPFDALVTACHTATNNFDRVTALGALLAAAQAFHMAAGGAAGRYRTPVQNVLAQAVQDLNVICGAAQGHGRNLDIIRAATGQPLVQKTITANVFYIAQVGAAPVLAPIDAIIDAHILTANTLASFVAAGIRVQRSNAAATVVTNHGGDSILLTAPAPLAMIGKFQDSAAGGERLIAECGAIPRAGRVDIVYVDEYDQADIQGRTFRAGQNYNGAVPVRPIVTVRLTPAAGGGASHPTTLVHELGHALTGDSGHSADAAMLMASGNIRGAVNDLSPGHVGWFRRNAHVV